MKKITIYIIFTYLIAFIVNFIDSIKYPDSDINLLNFIASSLFIVSLFIGIKYSNWINIRKIISLFLLSGFITGILNYITYGEISNIAGLSSALYCLFITPFFGINLLFKLKCGLFSAIISLFYLISLSYLFIISQKK